MVSHLETALELALSLYEIPEDDLVGDVLVLAMGIADEVRVGAGFFTSACLGQVAPGLAAQLTGHTAPIRMLISPAITDEDRAAITRAGDDPVLVIGEAVGNLFEEAAISPSLIQRHAVQCLAYLLAVGRLEIKFVLMPKGQYHKKIWLFRADTDWVGVHGSGNATARGLFVNGEQMSVDRSWCDGPRAVDRLERLRTQWDRQWSNEHPRSLTVDSSVAVRVLNRLHHSQGGVIPTVEDFWDAWEADHAAGLVPELPPGRWPENRNARLDAPGPPKLAPPEWLEWRTGRFSHQSKAVAAFSDAGGRGILAVATGGGKTKIALLSAYEQQEENGGPFLCLILVPSKPLLRQWVDEVSAFGIEATVFTDLKPVGRARRVQEIIAGLREGSNRTEVIIATNQFFTRDAGFRQFLEDLPSSVEILIIGDEMHNLGAPSILKLLPIRCNYRLGLSATHVRQYDPDGTAGLMSYFGDQIYEFSLKQAIDSKCLVPYTYHLHEVALTQSELDQYEAVTLKLIAVGFGGDDEGTSSFDSYIRKLLIERRAVLENASGKIQALRDLLSVYQASEIQRTLIYASAKQAPEGYPRQIRQVNDLVRELGLISHQFTNAETARGPFGEEILRKFGEGEYQILTAMKVLDEGVDIPQTHTAFLLASSTVRREWVQRRGRVLRSSPGKNMAHIHDFLVVPPTNSRAGQSILRSELARAEEFAAIAENEWDTDGPRQTVMSRFEVQAWGDETR